MSLRLSGGVRSIRTRNAPDTDDTDAWQKRSKCRDEDPERFFPIGKGALADAQYEEVRKVCLACPVRRKCLADSLERVDEFGMFGGLTPDERKPLNSTKDQRNCLTCGASFKPQRSKQPHCGDCQAKDRAQGINQVDAFLAKFRDELEQACRVGVSDKALAERWGVSHYLIGKARQLLGIAPQPRWNNLRGAARNVGGAV